MIDTDSSHNIFKGNSTAEFIDNIATHSGGAIYFFTSTLSFEEFSTIAFKNNTAHYGGAMSTEIQSIITFSNNFKVSFTKNKAMFGETAYSNGYSKVITKGNSTVIFDDISARWCSNTCLPYTGQSSTVTIDSNGIVWCSNQELFVCLSINCYCKNLEDILFSGVKSYTVIDVNDKVIKLSSRITLNYISIIGHYNPTVNCVNDGRLKFFGCSYIVIKGITWIGCGDYSSSNAPVIYVDGTLHEKLLHIQKCSFQHSIALYKT